MKFWYGRFKRFQIVLCPAILGVCLLLLDRFPFRASLLPVFEPVAVGSTA